MPADQIAEFDVNATDDWVNHSNVSLDVAPDVNVGERDPNVTTDNQSIEFDINATLGKGMEHEVNKQNVNLLCMFSNMTRCKMTGNQPTASTYSNF